MKNLNYPMFLSLSMMGIIITMNSSSWLSAWLGMELNILGFIPLILEQSNSFSNELIMKYFLINSISSLIILFFSLCNFSMWMFSNMNFNEFFIMISIGMKLGCAPFHIWFISFLKNMNLTPAFLLMTFQKMPPLILMNFCLNFKVIMLFLILSILIGSFYGIFQTSIMKILAYSSISHLSWIFSAILNLNKFWIIYFFSYTLMLIPIFIFIFKFNFFDVSKSMLINSSHKMFFFISMISFMGFPPLFGFFPKLFIILSLMYSNQIFMAMFLILLSMLNMYFYMRMFYNYMFIFNYSTSFLSINMMSFFFIIISFISPLIFFML